MHTKTIKRKKANAITYIFCKECNGNGDSRGCLTCFNTGLKFHGKKENQKQTINNSKPIKEKAFKRVRKVWNNSQHER